MIKALWLSYHVRGYISSSLEMPISYEERKTITADEFKIAVSAAHNKSKGTFDKTEQSRRMLVELYKSVPLKDKLALANILRLDCEMFGYDPMPPDIFPELN